MSIIPQFKRFLTGAGLAALVLALGSAAARAADSTNYFNWALTPPMGWNSYDAYGDSVTEAEVLTNAIYLKDHLASHGWKYVVVDYRWYDPGAYNNNPNSRKDAPLTMDRFGRLLPSPNRFPSAAGGWGFGPLAYKIQSMGLKFGIHIMRGIPRLAVKANLPIQGSDAHAWDASSFSLCVWNPDMFGVAADSPAGQAYYDSIMHLYSAWGVDFIKVDDLSFPYRTAEVEAIRRAIDKTGRHIVFSTSPGETPLRDAEHVALHASMWRMSGDFWDNWKSLDHAFDLDYAWQGVGGPGHWPDSDMIPVGRIGLRSVDGDRRTRFTHDEQITLMSLWALAPSPLMLGANLPDNDDWTLALLTNDDVLAVNQDPLGKPARRVAKINATEVWAKELKDGSLAVGLFNRGPDLSPVTVTWADAGLSGPQTVRNLWTHLDLGVFDNQFVEPVPSHGSMLFRVQPVR
jgi:alpha-galactosidase